MGMPSGIGIIDTMMGTRAGASASRARTPIFSIDLPIIDDPLPKFLDDAEAAALLRAASSDPDPLRTLVIHLLLRTGMRVGELSRLDSKAVVTMRDGHWLRIPLVKLRA